MEKIDFNNLFQGISTLINGDIFISVARVSLILLGILLVYLGRKGILEALIMIPMGLGMAAVNCGVLIMPDGKAGNIFVDALATDPVKLMDQLQINFLQPIYTFMFSNGLIACLVFMGIGVLLDINFLLRKPFTSMFLALFAELGTFLTLPLAHFMGLNLGESASVAMIGGADGPMVLFTSLSLAKKLFVPISVVAYLYLGLTYGGYPYLVRLMVPQKYRAIKMKPPKNVKNFKPETKIAFAVLLCVLLCILFPIAAPLFLSLFVGVVIRESGLKPVIEVISGPILYSSTFFLGLMLGVLCDAQLILDPRIIKLLLLGITALFLSGVGGLIGGWVMYFITRGNFNPVIGIAGVSCVPTTAKVAQKIVSKANPSSMILPDAVGVNICGVITSAIIAGIYITIIPLLN